MKTQFTVELDDANSVFGISAATLTTIAAAYKWSVERTIARALMEYVKREVPDIDLDEPALSPAQIAQLYARRQAFDDDEAHAPELEWVFKQSLRNTPKSGA